MKNLLLIALALYASSGLAQSPKPFCQFISPDYLIEKFGSDSIAYRKYVDLLSSRKVFVQRGLKLNTLIAVDKYSYGSLERGVKLVQHQNGITGMVVKEDGFISLPLCSNTYQHKKPASVFKAQLPPTITKVIKKKKQKKHHAHVSYSAGVMAGMVDIKRGSSKLSTNVGKISGKAIYPFNNKYKVIGSLSLAKFFNLTHSEARESSSPSSLYPELGVEGVRMMGPWRLGLAYDMLNYFLVQNGDESINLRPNLIHRLSLKPFYALTERVGIFSGIGLLKGFGRDDISGYDFTLGSSFSFGRSRDYTVSAAFYQNVMDTSSASINDESTSWVAALSKSF